MPTNAQQRHAVVGWVFSPNCCLQKSRYTRVWDIVDLCAEAGFPGMSLDPAPCPLSHLILRTIQRKYLHTFSPFPLFLCPFWAFLHYLCWNLYRQHHLTYPVLVLPLNIQHIPQSLTSTANSKQNCMSNRLRISCFPVTQLVSLQLTTLILL